MVMEYPVGYYWIVITFIFKYNIYKDNHNKHKLSWMLLTNISWIKRLLSLFKNKVYY